LEVSKCTVVNLKVYLWRVKTVPLDVYKCTSGASKAYLWRLRRVHLEAFNCISGGSELYFWRLKSVHTEAQKTVLLAAQKRASGGVYLYRERIKLHQRKSLVGFLKCVWELESESSALYSEEGKIPLPTFSYNFLLL